VTDGARTRDLLQATIRTHTFAVVHRCSGNRLFRAVFSNRLFADVHRRSPGLSSKLSSTALTIGVGLSRLRAPLAVAPCLLRGCPPEGYLRISGYSSVALSSTV